MAEKVQEKLGLEWCDEGSELSMLVYKSGALDREASIATCECRSCGRLFIDFDHVASEPGTPCPVCGSCEGFSTAGSVGELTARRAGGDEAPYSVSGYVDTGDGVAAQMELAGVEPGGLVESCEKVVAWAQLVCDASEHPVVALIIVIEPAGSE